jgi:hypothetical protein
VYIIVGTGISSLVLAKLLIKKRIPGHEIILIETSDKAGGLFGYLEHDDGSRFDIGMHTLQLTGNLLIDEIILSIVDNDRWAKYQPPRHDLSGTIIHQTIFENGPYFDLHFFDEREKLYLEKTLRHHLGERNRSSKLLSQSGKECTYLNAQDYLYRTFGKEVSDKTYARALQERYNLLPNQLGFVATQLTPMNRIAANTEFDDEELTTNELARSSVSWSNQRSLPETFSSNKPVFYPRNHGINHFITETVKQLEKVGVHFQLKTKIERVTVTQKRINELHTTSLGIAGKFKVDRLFWTGNPHNLLNLLGLKMQGDAFLNPLKTTVATIRIPRKRIKSSDCMYFFAYLNKSGLYRLNNYAAYSMHDEGSESTSISLEYLIDKTTKIEPKTVKETLIESNFIDPEFADYSIKIHELPFGHPFPSNEYLNHEILINDLLEEHDVRNLSIFGVSLSKRRFFQKDVLLDLLEVVKHVK